MPKEEEVHDKVWAALIFKMGSGGKLSAEESENEQLVTNSQPNPAEKYIEIRTEGNHWKWQQKPADASEGQESDWSG